MDSIDPADSQLEDRIRMRAYLLWLSEGSPDAQAEEFWYRAEVIELQESEKCESQPPNETVLALAIAGSQKK